MIRLILFFFLFFSTSLWSQTYTELVDQGDRELVQKDYYQAILFYNSAFRVDSNSIEINWKLAEVNRLYKDYATAQYFYNKVYRREFGRIYPLSVFWLATMQQQLGDYTNAKRSFKSAKKIFKFDRGAYHYLKSVQSFKACIWAENQIKNQQIKVESIGNPINSKDSELAPFVHDNNFYFTALKADSILESEEVISNTYHLNLFKASKFKTNFSEITTLKGLDNQSFNFANGSISADGKRIYFSRCNNNFNCKIFVGNLKDGRVTNIDSLGEVINDIAGTTTMPHVAIVNNEEYLFFVSNRYKTLGGLDIWASKITNGNQYGRVFNLGDKINTIEDDISPFYDPETKRVYFSSSWHQGFGAQDIFYAQMIDWNWRFNSAVNLGSPINSPQNDTYFFKDTVANDIYFSSNRVGVEYSKSPNCCNDIFMVKNTNQSKEVVAKIPDLLTINNHLPTLYFHNDEPNPKTTDTTTTLSYLSTFERYRNMQNRYKKEYSKGLIGDAGEEAKEDIEDFFIEYVEKGVSELSLFSALLKQELEKGQALVISVKGFASPLAKSDYNVNLTKRRIASFYNYLNNYESGVLKPFLNNGQLSIESIPFGEYTANAIVSDNVNDQKNSVYSRKASLERKIEIQSVNVQSSQMIPLKFNELNHDFGIVSSANILETNFSITNNSIDTIMVRDILNECDCSIAQINKKAIAPNESSVINVKYNPSDDFGLVLRRVLIRFSNGYTKTVSFSAEVK
ncbi:MAG: DUF1573 domain-containing protein [Crocinitomicaceae bacterium]